VSMSILTALDDRRLFASALRDKGTWAAWRAFLAALFGLPMSEAEAELWRQCTGRAALPVATFAEAWLICGRRAGKSFVLALIAVYLAAFKNYRPYLGPGERATIMVIAADRRQARVIMRYVKGLLAIPALAELVEGETAEQIDLKASVTIEVGTASHRTIRGYTVAAALCDELAFWPQEDSMSPDAEILTAIRPAMATIPNAMLLCASSPYARRGALWDAFRRFFGVDDASVLVWKAPTRTMNATVPQRTIDEAVERDPSNAASEYGAEFRNDLEAFVSIEAVQACIDRGIYERAPLASERYEGFVDPSGGSGSDSFTAAVGHRRDDGVIVLDAVREVKPPFSPEAVATEMSSFLLSYRVKQVRGDHFGGEWPREQFRKCNVNYEPSAKPKSALYAALLPIINSRGVRLVDNSRLVSQLVGLERRTARGGKDSIDHGPSGHDDVCNSVAGVVSMLIGDAEPGLIGYYRGLVEEAEAEANAPSEDVYAPLNPDDTVAMRVMSGSSTIFGLSGRKYNVGDDGSFMATAADAAVLKNVRGFALLDAEAFAS
jgi:hypothetical protein